MVKVVFFYLNEPKFMIKELFLCRFILLKFVVHKLMS